ncbi:pyridoxamine 5'-phosphate oxidase family protein [Salinibaculum rarum]|uniref:pyridoxamine 5'-phosphate oxidase family protein n=1 Tax=Salinibaculum rarum TaxID=3058903 RepID=UPI00265DEC43|nr:pyridoxamine 5'-phosphate oxidase family protein [Salinibaculum sp. KK48]
MTTVDGVWSQEEAATFLDEAIVPIRLGCHNPSGGLWMLSLWFRYRDGVFECATSMGADVVRFLREDDDVCFEVSTNRPPYMGVRGAGTATLEEDGAKDVLRALVDRYLGTREAEMAQWLLSDEREEVTITIDPSRLHTWDFSPRMQELVEESPAAQTALQSPKYD